MTKAFLNLPKKRVSYLPKISSHRFPQPNAAYKSDGGDPGDEDPDGTKRAELLAKFQSMIDTSLATRATKEELIAIKKEQAEGLKDLNLDAIRSMVDDKTGVMPKLIEQGLQLQRLENEIKKRDGAQPKDMSTRGQIKAWLQTRVSKDEADTRTVADLIGKIKGGVKQELPALEIRAVASPMLFSTVNSGASPWIGTVEVEPGINDLVRPRPVFWDYVTKGRTNARTYVWINKSNPQGAAGFIGPGVLKPGISFELVAETSVAKKIAVSAKTSTELLEDIDGMASFIEQELKYQLNIQLNTQLMTGTSSSTNPGGIRTLSGTYTTTTIKTANPNYMDALRAVVGQMRSGWLQGAITIFINSIDAANMDLTKASTSGVYMMPPFVTASGQTIAGAVVVEDNNIPVGYFQAAMLQYYRILIYKDLSIMYGWENDDFTKNLSTVIAEMRLHQFFNDQFTGAFIYDTFANVKTAITAV